MDHCPIILTKEMLPNPVEIYLDDEHPDFLRARQEADRRAGELLEAPLLLAWFDRNSGNFSPRIDCCREDKPSWLLYAESRGGNLSIDINAGMYVFIYTNWLEE